MELPIAEAAARLGISVDTLRRRLKAGQYESRKDPQGRILVTLAEDEAGTTAAPVEAAEVQRLEVELSHTRELLEETHRRADALERELDSVRVERSELRIMLANAQQQLGRLLPPPRERQEDEQQPHSKPTLWKRIFG